MDKSVLSFIDAVRIALATLDQSDIPDEIWEMSISKAFDALKSTSDLTEIKTALEMDVASGFALPEALRRSAIERRFELGDLTCESLWQYASHLGMYFNEYRNLFHWLVGELEVLEASDSLEESYRNVGIETLERIKQVKAQFNDMLPLADIS